MFWVNWKTLHLWICPHSTLNSSKEQKNAVFHDMTLLKREMTEVWIGTLVLWTETHLLVTDQRAFMSHSLSQTCSRGRNRRRWSVYYYSLTICRRTPRLLTTACHRPLPHVLFWRTGKVAALHFISSGRDLLSLCFLMLLNIHFLKAFSEVTSLWKIASHHCFFFYQINAALTNIKDDF